MLIDLHVYTDASEGPDLERVLKQAEELGIDAICVADKRASEKVATLVANDELDTDIDVFVGVEIETLAGDVLVIPESIDPFLTQEEWRELDVYGVPSFAELQEVVNRTGGVILGVHPYDRERTSAPRDRIFVVDDYAGLEIWTADAGSDSNRAAYEAVANASVPAFAGSATKRKKLPKYPWVTLLGGTPSSQKELVDVLRAGNFWPVEIVADGGQSKGKKGKGKGGRSRRN
jgi:predicted metal-dependent phosphoesterase TrpH